MKEGRKKKEGKKMKEGKGRREGKGRHILYLGRKEKECICYIKKGRKEGRDRKEGKGRHLLYLYAYIYQWLERQRPIPAGRKEERKEGRKVPVPPHIVNSIRIWKA